MTEPGDNQASRPRVASGDASTRLRGRSVVVAFGVVLLAILVIAAVVAMLVRAPAPPPDCQPGTDCGGPPPAAEVSAMPTQVQDPGTTANPPPGAVGIRAGTPWQSTELGYEFEYSDWWAVDSSDGHSADLFFQGIGEAELIVSAVPASDASAEAYADHWFGELQKWAPDIKADTRPKNTILGPSIGFVDGVGRTYAGSKTSPQGATSPVGISLMTASDGRTTVAVIVVVWDPESAAHETWQQYFVRGRAELILKTFRWGPVS